MSESGQDKSNAGGYILVALVTAAVVYSCTATSNESRSPTSYSAQPLALSEPTGSALPLATQTAPTTLAPPRPMKHYDAVEGTTYYYNAGITEEERKKGKQAPDTLAFWYLGKDAEGRDMIQDVVNGVGSAISVCARPCRIIHENGRDVGFDEGSIIGAAFSDAQRGFLKKHVFAGSRQGPWSNYRTDPTAPSDPGDVADE